MSPLLAHDLDPDTATATGTLRVCRYVTIMHQVLVQRMTLHLYHHTSTTIVHISYMIYMYHIFIYSYSCGNLCSATCRLS